MRTTRAMLMNFCSILLVSADFACEKVNDNIVKRQKLQLLSNFLCQDISKNGLHSEIMLTPQVPWKTVVFLKFGLVIYKSTFTFTFTLPYTTVHFSELSKVS